MAKPGASFTANADLAGHYAARYRTFGRIAEAMELIWTDLAAARETN